MPATLSPAIRIGLERARAHWHLRQGLAEPIKGELEEVIAATGWPRTLGGIDVYLAMRARIPGIHRRDLDNAVEQSRLKVTPAVRGCIHLVPAAEAPLVLRIAEEQYRKRAERELEKVGVSQRELAGVCEAVVRTLAKGQLTPDALRRAMPAGVVRSLGEKGKKLGISSPLPPALRHLEFEGKIERVLEGGRLDSERYAWRLVKGRSSTSAKVPQDPIERYALIARSFFRHSGPSTVADFSAWAALSQKDARAAIDRAGLAPIAVKGYAEEAFVLEEELEVLRRPALPSSVISALSFEDNYVTLHGGPGLLTDAKHHGRKIGVWGSTKATTLGDANHIAMRALLDGDQVIGFWEFDPDAGNAVFGTFEPLPAARLKAVAKAMQDVGAFISELGHARSFSLDTTDAVRERARGVKALSV